MTCLPLARTANALRKRVDSGSRVGWERLLLPVFRLVFSPDSWGEFRNFEFEADDPAPAFAEVDRHNNHVRAEIWQGATMLCFVEATPAAGKLWIAHPSGIRSLLQTPAVPNKKEDDHAMAAFPED